MIKRFIQSMCLALAFFFWAGLCQALPVASIPDASYVFETVPDGSSVVHDFKIQNTGDSLLVIEEVVTG